MRPCLYVGVSHHGFGHIAQTAPVVNALRRRQPRLRLVVQSGASREVLARHFLGDFDHVQVATDVGMAMTSSLDVDAETSHRMYLELHAQWEALIAREMRHLAEHQAGLVLANVPYRLPVAAQRAGIPSVLFCSLNWADVYRAYCAGFTGAAAIEKDIREAYASAERCLTPIPCMPMEGFAAVEQVGPVARIGCARRKELRAMLNLSPAVRIVLLSLGGIPTSLALERWPQPAGVHWIVSDFSDCPRPDITPLSRLDLSYMDVLRSVDALITKPGYGTFADAACNAVPTLYVRRGLWPEEPYLVHWFTRVAVAGELSRQDFDEGRFATALELLWQQRPVQPVTPTGIEQAADSLERYLV